jgi:hypothetical protein
MSKQKSPLITPSQAGIDLGPKSSLGFRGFSGLNLVLLMMVFLLSASTIKAQTTQFSFQGRLTNSGNPADGQYDFQFKLFDTATTGTGTQQGGTLTQSAVQVTGGVFNVQLDFGACASCFNGSPRFLEIAVKANSDPTFTMLSPRQSVDANPYAIRSLAATAADGLSVACVSCITSGQVQNVQGSQITGNIAGSQINGAIPVTSVPGGSSSYIQNTTSQQSATNFNISGSGTAAGMLSASIVNASTQYSLGGATILSNPGSNNLFAGVGSGQANSNGINNAFFGAHAGQANLFGSNNTFVGFNAGLNNTGGILGGGRNNTFFGSSAGESTTTPESNSFFGQGAGQSNTTGDNNTFIGRITGNKSGTGRLNTFVGAVADFTTANAFGDKNTLVGASTQILSGLTNATAIGSQAMVTQSNSIVLGQINGVNGSMADTDVGIGTTAPATRLHIKDGNANILMGSCGNGSGIVFDTSIHDVCTHSIISNNDVGISLRTILPDGFINFIAGTGGSASTLGSWLSSKLDINTKLRLNTIPAPVGSTTQLCFDTISFVTTCSSSLRYKKDLEPFAGGLSVISQLKPITFRWKGDNVLDVGFGAEDVAKVEPLLTFNNNKGQIEGVKYDRMGVVFVNAIKEQQSQIEQQQAQSNAQQQQINNLNHEIEQLNAQVTTLKKILCLDHPDASLCKPN